MTKRAEKIIEYKARLDRLNPESDKYDELYSDYIKYLNSDEDKNTDR